MHRDRRHRDPGRARLARERVGGAQMGEEIGRGLGQVSRGRQVQAGPQHLDGPEAEPDLARPRPRGLEPQHRVGRVVRLELARRRDMAQRAHIDPQAQLRLDRFDRQRAGAQQHGDVAVEAEDGRFEPDRAGPAFEDRGDPPVQPLAHMVGPGRADGARRIGRWRGERPSERREQPLGDRMIGDPQRDGRQARGREFGEGASARRLSTRVSGPGQKARARSRAGAGSSAIRSAPARSSR